MRAPESGPPGPPQEAPRRLRRAEAVLARRTGSLLLVVERCEDDYNYQAVLRTADCFGVQKVWIVATEPGRPHPRSNPVTKGAWRWLSLRHFPDPRSAIEALREEGWTVWATDLSRAAEEVGPGTLEPVPDRLALVVGRETDGVSQEMLAAARRRLYLPVHGFSESLNLNAATALFLQRIFDARPGLRGDLTENEKAALRAEWYPRLARSERVRQEFLRWLEHPPPPLPEVRVEEGFRIPRRGRRRS